MRKEMLFESDGVQLMRSSWGGRLGELPGGWQSLDRPRLSFPHVPLLMGGGRSEELAAPGGAVLLDKETEHGVRAGNDGGGASLWLSFDPEVFDDIVGVEIHQRLRGGGEGDRGRLVLVPDPRACWAVWVMASAAASGAADAVACEALAYDVLRSVCSGERETGERRVSRAQREAVVRAAECLLRGEARTLEDVGRHVHAAPHHFCRVFRRCTGMTVQGFRRRVRVLRAAELVFEGRETLATIALACGYSDQAHMTRDFGWQLGAPPGRLRRESAALWRLRRLLQDAGRNGV